MRRTPRLLPAVALLALPLAGCTSTTTGPAASPSSPTTPASESTMTSDPGTDPTTPAGSASQSPSPAASAELGTPFTAGVGAPVKLSDGTTVTVDRVVEDSRCPKGKRCIWEGRVKVAVTIRTPTGQAEKVTVGLPKTDDNPATAKAGNVSVTLGSVAPERVSDAAPDAVSYRLGLTAVAG